MAGSYYRSVNRKDGGWKMIYIVCRYEGKPAILDTLTRVYYFFAAMRAAAVRAAELNN